MRPARLYYYDDDDVVVVVDNNNNKTKTAKTATTVMGNDEERNRTVRPSGRQAGKHNNNQPRTKSLREPNTYKLRDISGYIWCVREMMPPKLESHSMYVLLYAFQYT